MQGDLGGDFWRNFGGVLEVFYTVFEVFQRISRGIFFDRIFLDRIFFLYNIV